MSGAMASVASPVIGTIQGLSIKMGELSDACFWDYCKYYPEDDRFRPCDNPMCVCHCHQDQIFDICTGWVDEEEMDDDG
jgi:hypothetical protein